MSFCGCHGGAGPELTARLAPGYTGQRQVHGLIFMDKKLVLNLLPDRVGVCRLESAADLPAGLPGPEGFYSITGTGRETSLVCREDLLPAGVPCESGFRILEVEGPLNFDLTGILAALLNPLAGAGVPVFTISTYDTDYILIKDNRLEQALRALEKAVAIIRRDPKEG